MSATGTEKGRRYYREPSGQQQSYRLAAQLRLIDSADQPASAGKRVRLPRSHVCDLHTEARRQRGGAQRARSGRTMPGPWKTAVVDEAFTHAVALAVAI